ncbi:hypothetical protein PR048_028989 [Dryococelus australis]|uniref:DOP1 N-terminal domain-containing protein n=1 Tax=Dryococelus australis TaxID=614101 RepID=A0ABQ9GC50_9NEOP|nr:hypothetical protein PR048_028989 [Dryococelus australis]
MIDVCYHMGSQNVDKALMFSTLTATICLYRYVSAVDKALKSFEYTSEWADLISALGKLNKVSSIVWIII